ncbi:MAG: hypothetical protein LBU32_15150 [Clostridiales bacterium]|nr:hypothetical protein [Clostridiales bacterium]
MKSSISTPLSGYQGRDFGGGRQLNEPDVSDILICRLCIEREFLIGAFNCNQHRMADAS